jgi:very-short-patch-repair endonuclease
VDVELNGLYQAFLTDVPIPFLPVPEPSMQQIQEWGDKPTAKDFAERLGWSTSFDLREGSGSSPTLPILYYQDDFEVIARKIGSSARTAIEESGANLLHLVFGFLEWRESDDSAQVRHAPLLVVPVSFISPKRNERDRSIKLQYTGEDLTTNLSLVEKMRRDFGLAIPELEEIDTPSSYFERFDDLLLRKPEWRICRQVSLALLSFGKLLMYLDLDPERWPQESALDMHPRIVDIFSGTPPQELSFAEEYAIDDEELAKELPPLVCDADSSQHSALLDVTRGKNLVVEGPPGTGKSQTITNLIAASLAGNKTVLFIAEKMAALNVVKKRLDHYGLGHFCLELHSHKTNKVGMLKSVDQRIEAFRQWPPPPSIDDRRKPLESRRRELIAYVSLLNQPFGVFGKSPFEIIWARDLVQKKVPREMHEIDDSTLASSHEWDFADVQERRDQVVVLEAHLQRVIDAGGEYRQPGNPWDWIQVADLSFGQQKRLIAALREARKLFEDRIALIDSIAEEFQGISCDFKEVEDKGSTWCSQFPRADETCHLGLLTSLEDVANFDHVDSFIRRLEDYHEAVRKLPGGPILLDPAIDAKITGEHATLHELGVDEFSIQGLGEIVRCVEDIKPRMERARRLFIELSTCFGLTPSFTLQNAVDIVTTIEVLIAAPLDLAHLRGEIFERDGVVHLLTATQRESQEITSKRDQAAQDFVIDSTATSEELDAAAQRLDTTSWFGRIFSSQYKAARGLFRSHCMSANKATPSQMATSLRYLSSVKRRIQEFANRADLRSAFAQHFKGVNTSWDDLVTVAAWYDLVNTRMPRHRSFSANLRSVLLVESAGNLKGIVNVAEGDKLSFNDLQNLLKSLTALKETFPSITIVENGTDLSDIVARISSLAKTARSLLDILEPLRLAPSCTSSDIVRYLDHGRMARGLQQQIDTDDKSRSVLGSFFDGTATRLPELAKTLDLVRLIQRAEIPRFLKRWLLATDYTSKASWLGNLIAKIEANKRDLAALATEMSVFIVEVDIFRDMTSKVQLQVVIELLERCLRAEHILPVWADTQRTANRLRALGVGYLIDLCLAGKLPCSSLRDGFDYLFYDSLIRKLFSEHPHLWHLSGASHEETRRQFASLDKKVIELTQLSIADKASRRRIPAGTRGSSVKDLSEYSLIYHEMRKQRGHLPIRQILSRAGMAMQGLKPCFMMSPMSVAQFLAPGQLQFDLVVMDEASQLRPEDALGAVARGGQLVVVGDPKQLPPTSFFQRTLDDETEDLEDISTAAESESILDIAMNRYQPVRRLRWHYRSQHHSLVAFSNSEFYDGDLIVFPSAFEEHPELGVKYVAVNGVFENRRNAPEAQCVVDAVMRHIAESPFETLGVVTMNFDQQELIEDLLDKRLKGDASAAAWMEANESTLEPFFIKNLENVQGDERDVIFISVTYGPDSKHQYFQRFSGINGATGHRRLNVLVTRAKKRTVAFSSLDPDMIRSEPSTPWGVRALKGYLDCAKRGVSAQPKISSGMEPANEHELAVGHILREHGYSVVPQVGVSGYFIDLAVRHPAKPGAFLLGIEFDGASYHSGRSARDRDRLREMTLRSQGWNIHRIWSTDWFKSRGHEIERLLSRVRALEIEV